LRSEFPEWGRDSCIRVPTEKVTAPMRQCEEYPPLPRREAGLRETAQFLLLVPTGRSRGGTPTVSRRSSRSAQCNTRLARLEQLNVRIDHQANQFGEVHGRSPAQFFPRLARIAQQQINLS